jgi:hypothetical protein
LWSTRIAPGLNCDASSPSWPRPPIIELDTTY